MGIPISAIISIIVSDKAVDDAFVIVKLYIKLSKAGTIVGNIPVAAIPMRPVIVTEDDINITINNDVLFIHKGMVTEKEKMDTHYIRECHWGAIAREVHLPLSVDPSGTHATLQNGVLRITLPIIEKKKTKIIKIK